MTQREWLAECHAWLDDPTSVQYKTNEGTWTSIPQANPIDHPHLTWRIKPSTFWFNREKAHDAFYMALVKAGTPK